MAKKVYLDSYEIPSIYFKEVGGKTFLVLADLHYHAGVNKTPFKMVIDYVRKEQPDYILMPGDILDTDTFLNDKEAVEFFDTFIRSLSEVSKVIITPGNHDIAPFNVKTFFNRDYSGENHSMKYLAGLNRLPNVYFLNNEQLDMGNLTFLGLNPRNETYMKRNDPKTNAMFIEDYIKGNYHVSEGNYNIVLCHNPMPFFDQQVITSISDYDLFHLMLFAHWHNAYMKRFLDPVVADTDIGLFTYPWVNPYPGAPCRGIHELGNKVDGVACVSRGFRKYGSPAFGPLAITEDHDMELLTVFNPEERKDESAKVLTKKVLL